MAREEIMKKDEIKIPKNFGHALGGVLFDESDQNIFDFAVDFCNDHPKVKRRLSEVLKLIAQIEDEEARKSVEYYVKNLPDIFTESLLTIGFALGQAYEATDSGVKKDIDLVWKTMKEGKLFFIYPRHKRTP
jgi:hypothetical protein